MDKLSNLQITALCDNIETTTVYVGTWKLEESSCYGNYVY